MEYGEDQYLVSSGRAGLIDNNIGQAADDPFMGTRYTTDMPHARKFSQLFGSCTDTGDHLRGRDRIAVSDVAENCSNVLPRFRGEA